MEHGEVKSEAKLDGVAGGKVNLIGLLVGLQGVVPAFRELGVLGVLANVAVVVANHLDEEGLGLSRGIGAEGVRLDDRDDALAVGLQL